MAPSARRARLVLALVVVLVAVAIGASILLVRPDLADAADRADTRWTPLRAPLIARYEALGVVAQTLHAAGAAERAVTKELDETLARWSKLALRGDEHTDPVVETTVANELEALARRVRSNIAGSARLAPNTTLTNAMAAFDQVIPTPPAVIAYNRAVRAYEDAREGAVKRIVAGLLGYESRPQLALGP
jgi:hypothetical protein